MVVTKINLSISDRNLRNWFMMDQNWKHQSYFCVKVTSKNYLVQVLGSFLEILFPTKLNLPMVHTEDVPLLTLLERTGSHFSKGKDNESTIFGQHRWMRIMCTIFYHMTKALNTEKIQHI